MKITFDKSALSTLAAQGWRRADQGAVSVWVKGYLFGVEDQDLPEQVRDAMARDDIAAFLHGLDGHFALIATSDDAVLAAVDRVRSIPVFWVDQRDAQAISPTPAPLVAQRLTGEINPGAALAVAMAGFTVNTTTLYKGLTQLGPGEFIVTRGDAPLNRRRYHRYEPWRVDAAADEPSLKAELADVTMGMIEKMVRSASGRRIFIPLSAGLDSRLIVSALAELGARDVVCFAYGLRDNFEAQASQKIAKFLGYDWHFAPFTPASQKQFWDSEINRRYWDYADSANSTSVVHDLPAIVDLQDRGVIEDNAIIVNGNSGDYITGLHIQEPVLNIGDCPDDDAYFNKVADILIHKHFRLWDALATEENDNVIRRQLIDGFRALGAPDLNADNIHGLYEYAELQDRQAKFVISRQRIYEFLGLDWRLPLWSNDYLDFWQKVPVHHKARQKLYRDMLIDQNFGGVWQDPKWRFPPRVSPDWMRLIVRPLCKIACAPFGKTKWHRFERRYLSYWMDLFAWQALHPYHRIAADNRGARHLVSWHTSHYLESKGLDYQGKIQS